MVNNEKQAGNPIASLVHQLKLAQNKVILGLPDEDSDAEEEEEPSIAHVEIDLALSAHANACKVTLLFFISASVHISQ